jgi:hypothetical protein
VADFQYLKHDIIFRSKEYLKLQHAPLCPANHFHSNKILYPCTCGAYKEMIRQYQLKNAKTAPK